MKKQLILSVLVVLSLSASAQTWNVDKAHAKLGFSITHLMISDVEGSFRTYEATITSSKDDLSDAVFEISADIAGINTDNEGRDKDLQSDRYFDAAKFPKLSYKSTSFTKIEGNKYKLVGDLTIHGVKKKVTFDGKYLGAVKDAFGQQKVAFTATTKISRKDFGLKWNNVVEAGPVVGDEVTIKLSIQGAKPVAEAKK